MRPRQIAYLTDRDFRELLRKCLERRKRYAWTIEEVARAQFRLAQVLKRRNKTDEAKKYAEAASRTRRIFLDRYPDQLWDDPDEEVVFDQMVSLWAGRFTGKLKDGIADTSGSVQSRQLLCQSVRHAYDAI